MSASIASASMEVQLRHFIYDRDIIPSSKMDYRRLAGATACLPCQYPVSNTRRTEPPIAGISKRLSSRRESTSHWHIHLYKYIGTQVFSAPCLAITCLYHFDCALIIMRCRIWWLKVSPGEVNWKILQDPRKIRIVVRWYRCLYWFGDKHASAG